jgi:hypothetical protein
VPKQMSREERAAYQRDYRERKAAEEVVRNQPSRPVKNTPAPKKGDAVATESKYDCGCRPGNLCIGHGIANMDQRAKDVLLDRIHKVREGKVDSASLGSFDDALAKARR